MPCLMHRAGSGAIAEGQLHAAGILALATLDNAVDDAALYLSPENFGRKAKLSSDQLRVDREAVPAMAQHG
jgi:hypothetical protein